MLLSSSVIITARDVGKLLKAGGPQKSSLPQVGWTTFSSKVLWANFYVVLKFTGPNFSPSSVFGQVKELLTSSLNNHQVFGVHFQNRALKIVNIVIFSVINPSVILMILWNHR